MDFLQYAVKTIELIATGSCASTSLQKNISLKEIRQVVRTYFNSVFAVNVAYKLKGSRSKLFGSLIESGQGKTCG